MNLIQGNILFQLFEQVNERIWYYDPVTDMIGYVNSDGTTEEEMPFAEHMAMKHPDDCPQVYESAEYMYKHHAPIPKPLMIRYKDENQPDGYRYTLNSIAPIWAEDGSMKVVGSEQDITDMVRKQQLAEEQSRLLEALLNDRNERTWRVDVKAQKLMFYKTDGNVEYIPFDEINDRCQVIDTNISNEDIMATLQRGEAKKLTFSFLDKKQAEKGEPRYFKSTVLPSKFDFVGNVVEYIGISSDITGDVMDKEQMKQELTAAKEMSKKKSVFVARASHDLRNPLNVLLSLTDMMCMDISNEERKEMGDMMKQSGEALLNLINDILDLSRIESGTMQLTCEEFDVKQMVETVISSFEIQLNGSHTITLNAQVEKEQVTNDKKRLMQIVGNYLSNAIKYSNPNTEITVHLRSNENEGLYIAVQDEGCGISENNKVNVFDEFARFNTEVAGTGLGLSICKRIAEALGGNVGFESQLGVGSTFWVKFDKA